jgi:quercetin dioxygenase-like cupin family protein
MLHAYKLYTGADNASHVIEGTVTLKSETDVLTTQFAESPAHSALDWHDAPKRQYVITLSGTLEFITRDGEKFTLRPGDVLVAADDTGTGHEWRLIDDQPWRRVYVALKPGAPDLFVPNETK